MSKYAKFIAALAAALTVLSAQLVDGSLSTADVVTVVAAFLGAIGVYAVPNADA